MIFDFKMLVWKVCKYLLGTRMISNNGKLPELEAAKNTTDLKISGF